MLSRFFPSIAVALGAAMFCLQLAGAETKLRWTDEYVEAQGIDSSALTLLQQTNWSLAQWQRLLLVRVEQGDPIADMTLPAMPGSYRVEGASLRFQPKFPLEPGINYRAVFRPGALPGQTGLVLSVTHRIPVPDLKPTTRVVAIYPSRATLPQNLLKFYVHFSAPMSGGHIYDHIHLRDSNGKDVELPFLEIDEELWDPTMTRLTLLLDPGRIKRGVRPLVDIGPAFVPGKSYTLAITADWQDGRGAPMASGFEKKFAVTEPDRDPPDPAKWKIIAPKSGQREPLTLNFNKPLDHAILLRTLRVVDAHGATVAGTGAVEAEETRWLFTPDVAWGAGKYAVHIPTRIEDVAGNNIGKPFDVDLAEGQRTITNSSVSLPFTVR